VSALLIHASKQFQHDREDHLLALAAVEAVQAVIGRIAELVATRKKSNLVRAQKALGSTPQHVNLVVNRDCRAAKA
jgi:hypothetical protein